jgi:predicted metal-dependent peptidase
MSEVFGSRDNGVGESALQRSIDNNYKPQPFNWRKALTKYIRGWMKDNYTWNKPSRAGIANNLILPSAGRSPKMHIAVAVDTSGSIYDTELNTMMDHLFTILSQFKDFTVDVWCCGSKVYEDTFRTYTAAYKRDLKNFEFQSDGGNDMRENFKFLEKHYKAEKPDVFICMSDFYDPLDGDTTTTSICPCIFLCLDHDSFVPPKLIKSVTYPFEVESAKNR